MAWTADYQEFRQGWQVVFAAFLGIGLGLSPLPFYTLGIFREALTAQFGWTPEEIMNGLTVMSLTVLFAGPLAGIAADRFGVRKITLISVLLFGMSFMALGLSNGSLTLFYLNWGAIAVFGAGTLPITWTRAVNNRFDHRKGLALGLSLMGTGLFGYAAPPLATWLISMFGWRGAFVGIGLLPLLVALPVGYAMFYDRAPGAAVADPAPNATGLTFAETLGTWRFWLIAAALLPISFAVAGPIPNMLDILRNGGLDRTTAVSLVQYIGLSVIFGRLAGGWLLDRFWAPGVSVFVLSLPALSCCILANGPLGYEAALLAIVLIGFAAGIEYDIVAYFVARYFGMRSYAAVYGVLFVSFAIGAGFGPKLFARSFKESGSFDSILLLSAVLLVAGSAAFLLLGRYCQFAAKPAT